MRCALVLNSSRTVSFPRARGLSVKIPQSSEWRAEGMESDGSETGPVMS